MRILTAEETKRAEERANEGGMEFLTMMENAGSVCARAIANKERDTEAHITVACGQGKNGGDGFVIARKLKENGYRPTILLVSGEPMADDAIVNYDKAKEFDIEIVNLEDNFEHGMGVIEFSDVVIDCIFGTGFHGKPEEKLSRVFEMINVSKARVYSVDVPSGVNTDTGEICSVCIRADFTVAISTLKPAHVLSPAKEICGEIHTANIGINDDCFEYVSPSLYTYDITNNCLILPERPSNSNKGSFGRVLCITGSRNMPGAAVLCAKAAVRSGAGLIVSAFPNSAYSSIASHLTSPVLCPLPDNNDGTFSLRASRMLDEQLSKASCVAIGCGIGVNHDTAELVKYVIQNAHCPVVIDADALNCLADFKEILKDVDVPLVLTPHPGEMSRLCGLTVDEILRNKIKVADDFANQYDVTLVLKGSNTVIASNTKRAIYINVTGNEGMAKGGSGDVLTGIIASFIAQGIGSSDAASAAVYIHGLCGDLCRSKYSSRGMTPTDMIRVLPKILKEFEPK